MKLRDIINRIDKSPDNMAYSEYHLLEEMGFHGYYDISLADNGFKSYYLTRWNCTDSHVGTILHFYNDEFFALSIQQYRKMTPEYYFLSDEKKREIKNILISILPVEEDKGCQTVSLDNEIGEYYTIEWTDDILDKKAFLDGEEVTIIKNKGNSYTSKIVGVKLKNNKIKTVDVGDLKFPIHIKGE